MIHDDGEYLRDPRRKHWTDPTGDLQAAWETWEADPEGTATQPATAAASASATAGSGEGDGMGEAVRAAVGALRRTITGVCETPEERLAVAAYDAMEPFIRRQVGEEIARRIWEVLSERPTTDSAAAAFRIAAEIAREVGRG